MGIIYSEHVERAWWNDRDGLHWSANTTQSGRRMWKRKHDGQLANCNIFIFRISWLQYKIRLINQFDTH